MFAPQEIRYTLQGERGRPWLCRLLPFRLNSLGSDDRNRANAALRLHHQGLGRQMIAVMCIDHGPYL
jgi:hypothetical protein